MFHRADKHSASEATSKKNISRADFRELWKKQYGQNITDEQAEEYEDRLVRLIKLLIDLDIEMKERPP